MTITFKPTIQPSWVQQCRSPDGVLPLVALDFKNNRYFVEGHGELPVEDVLAYDAAFGKFHIRHIIAGVGLTSAAQTGDNTATDGGSPRLTALASAALYSGFGPKIQHMFGDVTVVMDTNFNASGSDAKAEFRKYKVGQPTEYVGVIHSALSAGSNAIVAHMAAHPVSGSESTIQTTWAGDAQPGLRSIAATLNTFRLRGTTNGSSAISSALPDFDTISLNSAGIIAPVDGALERVLIYRQQEDVHLIGLSHNGRVKSGRREYHALKTNNTFVQTVTPLTIAFPRSYNVGDLLILWVMTSNEAVSVTTSGWTEIAQVGVGTGSASAGIAAFWKRAGSTNETPPTISATSAALGGTITVYSGVSLGISPINAFATLSETDSLFHKWNTITPTVSPCRLIYGIVNGNGDVFGINDVSSLSEDIPDGFEREVTVDGYAIGIAPSFGLHNGSMSVMGQSSSGGAIPPVAYRVRKSSNIASIVIAVEPADVTLEPVAIPSVTAVKEEWKSAGIIHSRDSILSLVSGQTADFDVNLVGDRLFYRAKSSFSGSSTNIVVRQTHSKATNSPLDTTLSISVAGMATAQLPAITRRRQPRHWYTGGKPVHQFRIIPSYWEEAWTDIQSNSSVYFILYSIYGDEMPNNELHPILSSQMSNIFDTYSKNEKQLYLNFDPTNPPYAVTTAGLDLTHIDYEWVDRKTGEIWFNIDHENQATGSGGSAVLRMMIPGGIRSAHPDIGIAQAYHRRAQRDPETRQVTRDEDWIPMNLTFSSVSSGYLRADFANIPNMRAGGTAHLPNPLEATRRRFPLTINIPLPDPLPANFSLYFSSGVQVIDGFNKSKDRNLQATGSTFIPYLFYNFGGSNGLSYADYSSGASLAPHRYKMEILTGLAKITMESPFPNSTGHEKGISLYDEPGRFHRSGGEDGFGVQINGSIGASNFNWGSQQPVIGSGTIDSGNVGIGNYTAFASTPLQPTQPSGLLVNDIMCVVVLTGNETVTAPAGWRILATDGFGAPGDASTSLRGTILWKRATANGEAYPSFGVYAYKACCRAFFIRHAITTGNPFINVTTRTSATAVTQIVYGDQFAPRESYMGVVGVECQSGVYSYGYSTNNLNYTGGSGQWRAPLGGTSDGGGGIGIWEAASGAGFNGYDAPQLGSAGVGGGDYDNVYLSTSHSQTYASEYVAIQFLIQRSGQSTVMLPPSVEIANPQVVNPVVSLNNTSNYIINGGFFYRISTQVFDETHYAPRPHGAMNTSQKIALELSGDGTYTPPYSPPSVLAHTINFTTQTAVINGTTITNFATLLGDLDISEITSAGMRVQDGESRTVFHQPKAIGALYNLMTTQNYCMVIEWDQGTSNNNSYRYLGDFVTTDQYDGSEAFFVSSGNCTISNWNGNYNSLPNQLLVGARNKIAISYNTDGVLASLNGGGAVMNAPAATTSFEEIHIGCSFYGGSDLNGTIRSIKFYNNGRRSADVRALSSLT